jgi:hypothetical protein
METLLADGRVRTAQADFDALEATLVAAERDIAASAEVAAQHPGWSEAMLYEAGLRSARAIVQAHGFRISSHGGHVAAIDAADALTVGRHHRTFVRLHRMRRMRHDFMYETAPEPSRQDLDQAERDVTSLIAIARQAVAANRGG